MFHHMHKTPIFNVFYGLPKYRFCPYCKLLPFRVSANPIKRIFSEWCTAYSAAPPISWRTHLLLAPAVVRDTSWQLGVSPCTTLCAFCYGSVTPPQGPLSEPSTKPETRLLPLPVWEGAMVRVDWERSRLTCPSSAVSLLCWIDGVVLSLFLTQLLLVSLDVRWGPVHYQTHECEYKRFLIL